MATRITQFVPSEASGVGTDDRTRSEVSIPQSAFRLLAFAGIFGLLLLFDESIYRYLHEHFNYATRPVPAGLRLATRLLRSLEDWGEDVFIAAVLFAMWQLDSARRSRTVCLVLSAVLVSLAVEGTKRIVGRERPEVGNGKLIVRGPISGDGRGDWHSFPSGHTASAGSYSGALAAFYPPLRPVCIALATGCGCSRVWKERHFASDCWFGGAFGFWFAGWLPRRRWMIRFQKWFDERARCMELRTSSGPTTANPRPIAAHPRLGSSISECSSS